MINLTNLNRQHEAIKEELQFIRSELKKGGKLINTAEAALHISKLAGIMKIHMLEEDRFLYPGLLQSSDTELQDMSRQYIAEMGDLAVEYTEFKNKYNVGSKILRSSDTFITEADEMLQTIEKRIVKEDNELYDLVKTRGL